MRFNLAFFLAEALKNLRLNLLMTITAVTTTFICILVFGLGLLVSSHIQGIIGSVREDVSVEAFMPNDTRQELNALAQKVKGWPEVTEVTKVSEQEAFAEFKDKFSDQPELYEDLDQGVLPPSVQIQLKDPSTATEVADRLKQVEVMKLVGASDGFVRTPFVFEGLLQGLAGSILAGLVVIWINYLFVDWAHNALPFVPISTDAVNAPFLILLLVAVGVAIGVIGSFLSVTRFLRKI